MSSKGMEAEINSPLLHNTESSLTESWNVVEPNDITVSEGSDGESIEVIDEEGNHTDSSQKECGTHTEASDSSRSDEDDLKRSSGLNESIAEKHSTSSTTYNNTDGSLLINALSIGVLLIGLMALSSAFSIMLLKFDNLAIEFMDFLDPLGQNYKKDRERQDLINEIQFYKEEAQGLKELVADLKGVVNSLKQEVINQKTSEDEKNKFNNLKSHFTTNIDNSLFQQLLNIHVEDHFNYTNQESDGSNQNSFQIVNEMLLALNDDENSHGYTKVVKTFYQIPKHLSVLTNFETSNPNIKNFIEVWNEKINKANEKVITDIKQMQQKIIRHVIQTLKSTQRNFFKKLCELKDMKKKDCYEVFLKPYENDSDDEIRLPNVYEGKQFSSKTVNIPDSSKNNDKKNNKENPNKRKENYNEGCKSKMHGNNNLKQKNKKPVTYNSKKVHVKNIKDNFVPGSSPEPPSPERIHPNQKENSDLDPATDYDKGGSLGKEKGMKNEFIQDQQKDEINLFSSFSEGPLMQGEKTGGKPTHGEKSDQSENVQRSMKEDNSWYLKLGSHRSKLRYLEARGEWMFDRARFRRRRSSPCCQHRTKY